MARLHRSREATLDVDAIVSYISASHLDAAERWLDRLERLFDLLSIQPEMGGPVEGVSSKNVRARGFGDYIVYYQSNEDGVEILRVVHGARDQSEFVEEL